MQPAGRQQGRSVLHELTACGVHMCSIRHIGMTNLKLRGAMSDQGMLGVQASSEVKSKLSLALRLQQWLACQAGMKRQPALLPQRFCIQDVAAAVRGSCQQAASGAQQQACAHLLHWKAPLWAQQR